MTKSQVDKLGERLKSENYSDDDLQLLSDYRRSFDIAYEKTNDTIRNVLKLEPTGRPAKSTASIIAKLQRQKSIRLSRIQDIAGCRIIADGISQQEDFVRRLREIYKDANVFDRRMDPSHGYRAVHFVVKCEDKLFEIQIRTILQHLWAEFSERLSDKVDRRIKYGVGPEASLWQLSQMSGWVAQVEAIEQDIDYDKQQLGDLFRPEWDIDALKAQIRSSLESMAKSL